MPYIDMQVCSQSHAFNACHDFQFMKSTLPEESQSTNTHANVYNVCIH